MEFDPDKPSAARIYDVYLGGKDNFEADRKAAEKVIAAAPSVPDAARNSRKFLVRAVRLCAERGVRQYIDIGTGIPTSPNVIEVAREVRPDAIMVGVDFDDQVIRHDQAMLNDIHMLKADLRFPDQILAHKQVATWIDWSEPVAVLFVAVLHFVLDSEDPAGIVAVFREKMAPGSLLVLSHASCTGAKNSALDTVERLYAEVSSSPFIYRTLDAITALFDGFEILEPGVVPVQQWRPDPIASQALTDVPVYGGVGALT